jgi:UDP-glucose 4-epimerase
VLNDSVYSYLDGANLIFHLACIQINHSSKNPELDLSVNALSTLRILEYLRRKTPSSLERFIYTSTTSIYGSPENLPISESSKPQILNHYAASKLLAEQYVMLYNLQYNIPVTVVRYSNVYGYGQTPLNPYCGVLGKFIHNALSGLPLSVFGDGEQTRDYTFIEDAISATILAALHPKAIGDVFNIGTSIETSVNKLVSYIAEVVPTAKIVHVPERDIDNIRRRALSISKISQKLGWTPKTTIAQGVRQTIEWYKLQIK